MGYGTKFIHAVLLSDGENYLLLLPGSISLLSGGTVQPKNIYSCIIKVTGQF